MSRLQRAVFESDADDEKDTDHLTGCPVFSALLYMGVIVLEIRNSLVQ
jgi:hypothetical protein